MVSYFYYCFIILVYLARNAYSISTFKDEEFHEELFVQNLNGGHVNAYFQFTTRWNYGDNSNLQNTNLMPRAIADILSKLDVKELQISLTQGFWNYKTWGYPVVDSATGAEAWAWFAGPNLTNDRVDEQWHQLANTFSGILCASLNFIDKSNSVEPKYSLYPQFSSGNEDAPPSFLRYSNLPREIVCTENLTPWKKLLPCNSNHGLASLLNSGHVHNTNYHSLGIRVRTLCESHNRNCVLEFRETANLVYDSKLLGMGDVSLRRLFGQGLNGNCVLADSSKIYVQIDSNETRYELSPPPMSNITSVMGAQSRQYGVYDLKLLGETKLFNIAWIQRQKSPSKSLYVSAVALPPLTTHRYILGRGQQRGQIITQIRNNHYGPLNVVVLENIPWFVPVYMHTLRLCVFENKFLSAHNGNEIPYNILNYFPGVQRTRPYLLELGFQIPAHSTVEISFDFDYIFLKWLEYPPDANHGHYLGAATISSELPLAKNYTSIPQHGYLFAHSFNASRPAYFLFMHTETLLMSLPTPDFSMPYNVICLACTVVALAFGPIHSVATKRIVVEQKNSTESQSLFNKIKRNFSKRSPKMEQQQITPLDISDTIRNADEANKVYPQSRTYSE